MRNEVVLDGIVIRIAETRFSPAGVPLMQLTLGHDAMHEEAGHPRRVRFQVRVMAVGESLRPVVERLARGDRIRVRGMLTRKDYRSEDTDLVLHAHQMERLGDREREDQDSERG